MAYELTRYGEERLETLPARLEERREKLKPLGSRGAYDSTFYKWNRQLFLLDKVRRGEEPLKDAFEGLKSGRRKALASEGLRKELASMLRASLIREVPSEGSEVEVTDPRGRVLPAGEAGTFIQKLQEGTRYLPQSRKKR